MVLLDFLVNCYGGMMNTNTNSLNLMIAKKCKGALLSFANKQNSHTEMAWLQLVIVKRILFV